MFFCFVDVIAQRFFKYLPNFIINIPNTQVTDFFSFILGFFSIFSIPLIYYPFN